MASTYTDPNAWKSKALRLNGQIATHKQLTTMAKRAGLSVEADGDDAELSFIARPGLQSFGRRVIGEIRGDRDAVLKITVKIE